MEFIKSSLAKKLIWVLIVILLVNFAVPVKSEAISPWILGKLGLVFFGKTAMENDGDTANMKNLLEDLINNPVDTIGGILLKPIFSLLTTAACAVNVTLGIFLYGINIDIDAAINTIKNADDISDLRLVRLDYWEDYYKETTSRTDEYSILPGNMFVEPANIFANDIQILNANLFTKLNDSSDGTAVSNAIKKVAAQLYIIIRNICALAMLAGLIYTGIRILLSSNIPSKKMQYLMLLEDWLIGMVLLIFSHIVMIIIFEISDFLVELLGRNISG